MQDVGESLEMMGQKFAIFSPSIKRVKVWVS